MAETVKKSRIVSEDDDNLEETLLEEFNLRLKNCMSKDNLQTADEHQEENSLYENISNNARPIPKSGVASNDFIQVERESYYEEPGIAIKHDPNPNQNGHAAYEEPENIYEILPEHHENEKTEQSDQYVDMISPDKATKNNLGLDVSPTVEVENANYEVYEIVSKDQDESSLVENSYEIVDDTPKFTLKTTDFSENRSPEADAKSSVKDRMFLATDDAATLLFTQTVTSPMLTPSEENIDFLKGFQRENTASDNTISTSNESPEKEELYKGTNEENNTSEISGEISVSEPLATDIVEDKTSEDQENIYENAEFLKNNTSESIYENLKEQQKPEEENIYENLEDLKKEDVKVDENIYQEIEECKKEMGIYENVEELKGKISSEPIEVVENNSTESVEEPEVPPSEIVTDLDYQESEHIEIAENSVKAEITEITQKLVESKSEHYESREETVASIETASSKDVEKNKENVETYSEFVHHSKTESNYYEKYTEVVSKSSSSVEISNREKDTETVPPEIVKNLKNQFLKTGAEVVGTTKKEVEDVNQLKTVNIMKQINKFEHKECGDSIVTDLDDSSVTHYSETTTYQSDGIEDKAVKKKKSKKSRKEEKENISVNDLDNVDGKNFYNVNVKSLCRSFGDLTKIDGSKYSNGHKKSVRTKSLSDDMLVPNKTIIENVFSDVSVRALKEKFNTTGNKRAVASSFSSGKQRNVKSSFSKFDALQKKNVLHVRSSDSAKAQEKFNGTQQIDMTNCKACSKTVFQMEQIKAEKAIWHRNCFRCTECSKQLTVETFASHEGNLYCKPHFKSLFAPKAVEDEAPPSDKPDLGLEELQSLNVKERFQVFEHHQTETQESDRGPTPVNVKRSPSILSKLARFQAKGMDVGVSDEALNGIPIEESSSEEEEEEEEEVPEGEDPTLYRAKKAHKEKPFHFTNLSEVKNKWEHGEQSEKARDERREERKQEIQTIRNRLFMGKQGKMKEAYQQAIMQSESSATLAKPERIESCDTKSLKERFEKGELFNERERKATEEDEEEVYESEISKKSRSLFLELDANASKPPQISPVISQKLDVKKARETDSPEREIYHDPDVVRSDEVYVDDSVIAKTTHTASKMLNKFRQMEENLSKEPEPAGPKPLKRFTPPPEPTRQESSSEEESGSEEESEDEVDNQRLPEDLLEAQKAARAKQLRAKFEKWEAQEIRKEQTNTVNIVEEYGDESQVETARSLRARFESLKDSAPDTARPRVKVNRFVEIPCINETCQSCNRKVYPLEKISVHGHIYHKNCFKCKECSCVLRMDSYSYNQGLLYCTPHFKRLFISKGNYDTAFGLDQHKEKWNMNATMA